jgi:predicted oxidoreductase
MLRFRRILSHATPLVACLLTAVVRLGAQGVTTGGISGRVLDPGGQPLDAVQIQIVNRATGFTSGSTSREGGR